MTLGSVALMCFRCERRDLGVVSGLVSESSCLFYSQLDQGSPSLIWMPDGVNDDSVLRCDITGSTGSSNTEPSLFHAF